MFALVSATFWGLWRWISRWSWCCYTCRAANITSNFTLHYSEKVAIFFLLFFPDLLFRPDRISSRISTNNISILVKGVFTRVDTRMVWVRIQFLFNLIDDAFKEYLSLDNDWFSTLTSLRLMGRNNVNHGCLRVFTCWLVRLFFSSWLPILLLQSIRNVLRRNRLTFGASRHWSHVNLIPCIDRI